MIAEARAVSFFYQLRHLLVRQYLYLLKNPRTFYGCIFIAICQIVLQSSLFHGVGSKELKQGDDQSNFKTIVNWSGFAFFAVSDPFISIGMA